MKLTVSTRPVRIEGNYVSVVFNRSHNSMRKRRLSTVWQILIFLRG
ncbi:hypothetical protein [Citrobacter portucalensis]|nr:hypothetical protein [Citrobacter portucalensis]